MFILKMASAVFASVLVNLQHLMDHIPGSQGYTYVHVHMWGGVAVWDSI